MGYRAPPREAPWYRFAAILWRKPTALSAPRLSFTSYRKLDIFVILARPPASMQVSRHKRPDQPEVANRERALRILPRRDEFDRE